MYFHGWRPDATVDLTPLPFGGRFFIRRREDLNPLPYEERGARGVRSARAFGRHPQKNLPPKGPAPSALRPALLFSALRSCSPLCALRSCSALSALRSCSPLCALRSCSPLCALRSCSALSALRSCSPLCALRSALLFSAYNNASSSSAPSAIFTTGPWRRTV